MQNNFLIQLYQFISYKLNSILQRFCKKKIYMKLNKQDNIVSSSQKQSFISLMRQTSKDKIYSSEKPKSNIQPDSYSNRLVLPKLNSSASKKQFHELIKLKKSESQAKISLSNQMAIDKIQSPTKKDFYSKNSLKNAFRQNHSQEKVSRVKSMSRGNILMSSQQISKIIINRDKNGTSERQNLIEVKKDKIFKNEMYQTMKGNSSLMKLSESPLLSFKLSSSKQLQQSPTKPKLKSISKRDGQGVQIAQIVELKKQKSSQKQEKNYKRANESILQGNIQNQQKSKQIDKYQLTQYKQFKPRIFFSNDSNMPYTVKLFRTLNLYKSYNLNSMFDSIINHFIQKQSLFLESQYFTKSSIWGRGSWQLSYFDNQLDYIYEYLGLNFHSIEKIVDQKRQYLKSILQFQSPIKSLAYHPFQQKYLPFNIKSADYDQSSQFYYFAGQFDLKQENQFEKQKVSIKKQKKHKNQNSIIYTLPRICICFELENPLQYINRLCKAIQQKLKQLQLLKFYFISENIQMNLKQKIPNKSFREITKRIGTFIKEKPFQKNFSKENQQNQSILSFEDQNELNQMFRTLNNRFQLQKVVEQQNSCFEVQNQKEEQNKKTIFNQNLKKKNQYQNVQDEQDYKKLYIRIPEPILKKPDPPLQISKPLLVRLNILQNDMQLNQNKDKIKNRQISPKKSFSNLRKQENEDKNQKNWKYLKIHLKKIETKVLQFNRIWIYQDQWMSQILKRVKFVAKNITLNNLKLFKLQYLKQNKIADQFETKNHNLAQSHQQSIQSRQQHEHSKEITQTCHHMPSLDEFLTVNSLNQMQNCLSIQINQKIISSQIIHLFDQIIENYKNKSLYEQDTINQQIQGEGYPFQNAFYQNKSSSANNFKYQLPLIMFYEQKLSKVLILVDQIVRQQVKMLLQQQIRQLCQIINNSKQKRFCQMFKIEVDFPNKRTPVFQTAIKKNYEIGYDNYSIISSQPKLSQFLALELSKSQIMHKFELYFSFMIKKLNHCVLSVEKYILFSHQIRIYLSQQMLQDGDKWLKIFKQEKQVKDMIRTTIEQKFQSKKLLITKKVRKIVNPSFISFVEPLINQLVLPLLKQIDIINSNLNVKKLQSQQFLQEQQVQSQQQSENGGESNIKNLQNTMKKQPSQIEVEEKVKAVKQTQQIKINQKQNDSQQKEKQRQFLLKLFVSIYSNSQFTNENMRTRQSQSIAKNIINFAENIENIKPKQHYADREDKRHSVILSSEPNLRKDCNKIVEQINKSQELLDIVNIYFSVSSKINFNTSQKLQEGKQIKQNLISECLAFKQNQKQQSKPRLIFLQTKQLGVKIKQKLISKIQNLKNILLSKFRFENNYVCSQIDEIKSKLSVNPKTVEHLIMKLKFIDSLTSEQFSNKSKTIQSQQSKTLKQEKNFQSMSQPSYIKKNLGSVQLLQQLQNLLEYCLKNKIKPEKGVLNQYYQNHIKLQFIYTTLIPQKIKECMMKKQMVQNQIYEEKKLLDEVFVEFNRNLIVIEELTHNIVDKIHVIKAQKHSYVIQSKQNNLQNIQNILNQEQNKPEPIENQDISPQQFQISDDYKIQFHFSIAQTLQNLYLQILDLCKKINYKQALFSQSLKQQSEVHNESLIKGSRGKHSSPLPHSPTSLEPLYIQFFNFWSSLRQWKQLIQILYLNEIGSIVLDRPQQKIVDIINKLLQVKHFQQLKLEDKIHAKNIQNAKRRIKAVQNQQQNSASIRIQSSINSTMKQEFVSISQFKQAKILNFLDQQLKIIKKFTKSPLKLLKVLKKQGFSKKNLENIGLKIQGTYEQFTLKRAIEQGFLDQFRLIQAASNEAWLSYHLQSTLERILLNLSKLKFQFISKFDKSNTQIIYVTNYKNLNEKIEQILLNLQTIHKNPSKQQFQIRLKNMHKQTLYISKCLQVLQHFQAKLLLISPIFQSAQIIKQLPTLHQKFTKVYRPWVQIITFMRRVSSVLDCCNAQNIFEKVQAMIIKIQLVRSQLSTYLEEKRKSFSKFFFLSDNEMFQLFSSTKDIKKVSKKLQNIFYHVKDLKIDQDGYITDIYFGSKDLIEIKLSKQIKTKQKNIEFWFNQLQKSIKITVFQKIRNLLQNQMQSRSVERPNYLTIIRQKCPQVSILIEQIINYRKFTEINSMEKLFHQISSAKQNLQSLINSKKSLQFTNESIYSLQDTTLNCLIILTWYQIETLEKFKKLKLDFTTNDAKSSYQFKKVIAFQPKFINGQISSINIESFDASFQYGCEFVGSYEKLVIIDLTQRGSIMCLAAMQNQQGNAYFGPAATGKSQTVKDLSRQLGKNCLIYNCSKSFEAQTFIRILKGSISSGVWICLDEFNLLDYTVMSVISQNLYILFKYRNFSKITFILESQMRIDFQRDNLILKPNFHFLITYNPNYQGRNQIPSSIKNIFRVTAMIKLDIQKISQIKMYIKGFGESSVSISKKLARIFRRAQNQWTCDKYDFGLRTLLSVIQLAGKKIKKSKVHRSSYLQEQKIIVESLMILNISRMQSLHKEMLISWIKEQFSSVNFESINKKEGRAAFSQSIHKSENYLEQQNIKNEKIQANLNNLVQLFKVRNGIIVNGKNLSGKQYLVDNFLSINSSKILYEKIFVNVLDQSEIYGNIDRSLNIWNDGILTKHIKNHIKILSQINAQNASKDKNLPQEKTIKKTQNIKTEKSKIDTQEAGKKQISQQKVSIFIFNGHLHYNWLQSLNTVLDNSRVLNLESGQSIIIPKNMHFIFIAQNLEEITPATLSRNGVIYLEQYNEQELMKNIITKSINKLSLPNDQIVKQVQKIIKFYKDILSPKILTYHLKYKIEKINIFYWIINYLKKQIKLLTFEKFIFLFFVFFQGLIEQNGIKILKEQLRKYFTINNFKKQLQKPQSNQNNKTSSSSQIREFILSICKEQPCEQIQENKENKLSIAEYQVINQPKIKIFHTQEQLFNQFKIFVKTKQSNKISHFWDNFISFNFEHNQFNESIVIFGESGSGKSSLVNYICSSQQNKKLSRFHHKKLHLTNSTSLKTFYNQFCQVLYKKSSSKLGSLPGSKLLIQIQDLYLSPKNAQRGNKFSSNHQLLRLILQQKEWYNYENLQIQKLQDIVILGQWTLQRKNVQINSRFYRHFYPIFLTMIKRDEAQTVFGMMAHAFLYNNSNIFSKQVNPLHELSSFTKNSIALIIQTKLVGFFYEINSFYTVKFYSKGSNYKKVYSMRFNDLEKIVKSIFEWKFSLFSKKKSQQYQKQIKMAIEELLAYQILRIGQTKLSDSQNLLNFRIILGKYFPEIKSLQISQKQNQNTFLVVSKSIFSNKNQNKHFKLYPLVVQDINDLIRQVQCVVDQYNVYSKELYQIQDNRVIVFKQFCIILTKMLRTLLSPKSNILFISSPTSGKTTLLKLCSFVLKGNLQTITKNYEKQQWLQFFKVSTKKCFKSKAHTMIIIPEEFLDHKEVNQDVAQFLKTYYLKEAYSQADFEELIYNLQSFLLKNNLEVNRQNCKYFFVEDLKQKFHLILNLYPYTKKSFNILNDYPLILKECSLFTLMQWPEEALLLATRKYLTDDIFEKNQKMKQIFVEIHKKCKQIAKQISFDVWNGQYFELMQTFKQQFEYSKHVLNLHKTKLQKGFEIVMSTQASIDAIRLEIKKIQPTIIQLQKQADRTLRSITIQKVNLQQSNQTLSLKNSQCNEIIQKSTVIKKELDLKNLQINQRLDKVWSNVQLIKSSHISEIKSLANPSEFIRIVLTSLVIIFYQGPIIKQKDEKGGWTEENYFQTARKHVLQDDAQTLANMLTGFNKDEITKQAVKKIEEKCMSHKKWNEKQAKSANKAVYYIFLWVQAIVKYFHMFQQTQPLRKQLRDINYVIQYKTKQVEEIKYERQLVVKRIQQLRFEADQKQNRLAQYSSKISEYQKTITRGEEMLKQIKQQKQKWKQYQTNIDLELVRLQGNCLKRSVTIVYESQNSFDARSVIKLQIEKILEEYKIESSQNNGWLLKPMVHEQLFKILDIQTNQYIKDNLMIIQSSRKPVTIIDPQEEGYRYLKESNKYGNRLVFLEVNEESDSLIKKIQESIDLSRILIIQFSSKKVMTVSNQLENKQNKAQQIKNINMIKDVLKMKYVQVTPSSLEQSYAENYERFQFFLNFNKKKDHQIQQQKPSLSKMSTHSRIYFYTNSSQIDSVQYKIRTQIVNFSLTQKQLQERIKKILVASEFPDVQLQIDETTKFSIKSKIHLEEIQIRILDVFVKNQASELLEDEQILKILSSSTRLYAQINKKLLQSEQKRIQLLKEQSKFELQGKRLSKTYFALKKVKLLQESAIFSFLWFQRILQTYPKNALDIISTQATATVDKKYRIIIQLLIASSYYSNLNWNMVYQKEQNEDINLNSQLSEISNISRKLQISKSQSVKIFQRIKSVSAQIQNLEKLFIQRSQIFKLLITAEKNELFESIPNEFANLQLFDRLLLISCFKKQDQLLYLLKNWLKTNFPHFNSSSNNNFTPVTNHYQRQPIVLIFDQLLSPLQKIKYLEELYKKTYNTQKSLLVISMIKSSIDYLKLMLQTAKQNDQWLIIQEISSKKQSVSWAVIQFFQSILDISKFNDFKVFICVDNIQSRHLPEQLVKFCRKFKVNIEISIQDKISGAFLKLMESNLLNEITDLSQKNQRKYFVSQLCILHFLLVQKTNYGQKLWNQKSITFQQKQLETIAKYSVQLGKNPIQLKKIIPQVAMQLVYGPKLADDQDKNMISKNIQDLMRITTVERNLFWTCLWANDNFPKNIQQYKQYVKGQIANVKIFSQTSSNLLISKKKQLSQYELFGIDSNFEIQQSKQIFNQIRRVYFYERQIKLQKSNEMQYIFETKNKLFKLSSILEDANVQINRFLASQKVQNTKLKQQQNFSERFQAYLNSQRKNYLDWFRKLKFSLEYYAQIQPNTIEDYEFYLQIYENRIVKGWKIKSKLSLSSFIKEFSQKIIEFDKFITQKQLQEVNQIRKSLKQDNIDQNIGNKSIPYDLKCSLSVKTLLSSLKSSQNQSIQSIHLISSQTIDKCHQFLKQKDQAKMLIDQKTLIFGDVQIQILLKVKNFYVWNCKLAKCQLSGHHDDSIKAFRLASVKQKIDIMNSSKHINTNEVNEQFSLMNHSYNSLNQEFYIVSVKPLKDQVQCKSPKREKQISIQQKLKNALLMVHTSRHHHNLPQKIQKNQDNILNTIKQRFKWYSVPIVQYPLNYNIETINYNYIEVLFEQNQKDEQISEIQNSITSEIQKKRVHLFVSK